MVDAVRGREPAPLFEMNMTPLIDVLLVLLVMFIITIPLQTDAVKIDLPAGPAPETVHPVRNKIVITADGVTLWNGLPITKPQLQATLVVATAKDPQPELHLQPDAAARYVLVDEVLAMSKRAGVSRMGFVGNEDYRDF